MIKAQVKAECNEWAGLVPPDEYRGCSFITQLYLDHKGLGRYGLEEARDALVGEYRVEIVALHVEHDDGLIFEAPSLVVWRGLHSHDEVVEALRRRLG